MSYCQDIKHISVKSKFTTVYNGLGANNDLKVQGRHGLLVVIEPGKSVLCYELLEEIEAISSGKYCPRLNRSKADDGRKTSIISEQEGNRLSMTTPDRTFL